MSGHCDKELVRAAMQENMATLAATAFCIGTVAVSTGSLHCWWGLLLLLNLNIRAAK